MSELARELGEAGGLDAPPSLSARLRGLLVAELERGAAELLRTRSGYGAPICIALAPADRALPCTGRAARRSGSGERAHGRGGDGDPGGARGSRLARATGRRR